MELTSSKIIEINSNRCLAMPNGYMGKILWVDLSANKIESKEFDEDFAKTWLGGKGFGVKILWDYAKELEAKGIKLDELDAFAPENMVIFGTGPGTGIRGFPCPGRHQIMGLKSPLTGSIGSANSGGEWGPHLKFAGYDAVVIVGKAEKPVYIAIIDGKAEIKDATHLWGMNTFDTTKALEKEYEKDDLKVSVACIGPAGENRVLIAAVVNDEHRAAGRTGMGAVMGSKNLKAIVAGGNHTVEIAKPDEFKELSKKYLDAMKENPVTGQALPTYGTAVLVNIINNAGMLPFKNWQLGYNEEADKISGESLEKTYLIKRRPCWGCTIACGRVSKVAEGPWGVLYTEGPEYESIWALGNSTGVMDLAAIIKANHYCDELGIDTISVGSTIACAMELAEKGKIPEEELQGIDLKFGNAAALVELIWRTAYKSGFGKYTALGARKLAEHFGDPDASMDVKGLEMPAYDPRGAKGIGLNYATSNRGGCHVTGYTISPEILGIPQQVDRLSYEGKALWTKTFQDFTSTVNSTVNCLFVTFALGAKEYAELLSAVTGWNLTENDLLLIGERIYNLERVIMGKLGIDGKYDTLPQRLLKEPMPEGPSKGEVVDLDKMLKEYYELRGWKNGLPTKEKLEELGLANIL